MSASLVPAAVDDKDLHHDHEASIDDLTAWFLSAKRSLTSVGLCHDANELVDTARAAIQEASIISARCVFLRNSLQDQLGIAGQIESAMKRRMEAGKEDVVKTLSDLNAADTRLNSTLTLLRQTPVDRGFDPPQPSNASSPPPTSPSTSTSSRPPSPQQRTLHDFVDAPAIEDLKTRLRTLIDSFQISHETLSVNLDAYSVHLSSLSSSFGLLPTVEMSNSTIESLQPSLSHLEERAESMGTLLASLLQHYDRCHNALRDHESHQPVSDPELITILARDDALLGDVVSELHEHSLAVKNEFGNLQSKMQELIQADSLRRKVFEGFVDVVGEMERVVREAGEEEAKWEGLQTEVMERLEEVWDLAGFYEGFVGAYDALVVEVARRVGIGRRAENIVREVEKKLAALMEEDLRERQNFKLEYGEHLPVDIWDGLEDPPAKWDMVRDLQGGRELPDLKRAAIEKAMRRRERGESGLGLGGSVKGR